MTRILREKTSLEVQVSRWCPARSYVELVIPEDVFAISKIVFYMESHDQGYSDDKQWHGTYQGSYTWFEAVGVSPTGHECAPKRVVQYNVHARSEYKRHEIVWHADDKENKGNVNTEDGSTIGEWVRSIRGGDAVRLTAKAQWPGWINFVREAEVEVYTSDQVAVPVLQIPPCYRPLSVSEIRLLRLEPGAAEDPEISCSLMYANLGQEGAVTIPSIQSIASEISYEALSYCWGNGSDRKDIAIHAEEAEGAGNHQRWTMSITTSLWTALKAMRPPIGQPARVLWVDMICVNQGNLDERSSQVAMMRDIYRRASRVVVWLGEGDSQTHRAIETVNAIAARYAEREVQEKVNHGSASQEQEKQEKEKQEKEKQEKEKQEKEKQEQDKGDLVALHHPVMDNNGAYDFIENWTVFSLPWFHRTWVVQEIFNAAQSVVCCGSDTVDWTVLLRINECLPRRGLSMKTSSKAIMAPIYNMLFGSTVPRENILDVLVLGLDLDVTDPRDKLFAMFQFSHDTADLQALPHSVVPNYSRSVRHVFALFTKWWIAKHQSLRILSAIQALEGRTWQETRWGVARAQDSHQLPSWSWGFRGHSCWAIGLFGFDRDCPYKAAGDTLPSMSTAEDNHDDDDESVSILSLAGFSIGSIASIKPYPYGARLPDTHNDLRRAYVGLFDPLNLTGKWLGQLKSQHGHDYMDAEPPGEAIGHLSAHSGFARETGGAFACISRCLFVANEEFIGLCPHAAQPGDWIVILHGGRVPYIVRPMVSSNGGKGQTFSFIGECYAHGYMHGEALEEQRNKAIPSRVFNLV